jgi:hypothetical protein
MQEVEHIPKTYAEAVKTLSHWQAEAAEDDLQIFAAKDAGDGVVRLIHVSDQFSNLGAVPVYRMGKSVEFPFVSAVALARHDQWKRILSGDAELKLPDDWKIDQLVQVWPSNELESDR